MAVLEKMISEWLISMVGQEFWDWLKTHKRNPMFLVPPITVLAATALHKWLSPPISNLTTQIWMQHPGLFYWLVLVLPLLLVETGLLAIYFGWTSRGHNQGEKSPSNPRRFRAEYSRGNLTWYAWIEEDKGPAYMEVQAFCPNCRGAIRAPAELISYCIQCGREFVRHLEYMEIFKDIQVAAQGDWRMRRRGFVDDAISAIRIHISMEKEGSSKPIKPTTQKAQTQSKPVDGVVRRLFPNGLRYDVSKEVGRKYTAYCPDERCDTKVRLPNPRGYGTRIADVENWTCPGCDKTGEYTKPD